MSVVWQMVCASCECRGPKVRVSHGEQAVLHAAAEPATKEGQHLGRFEAGSFLTEHEFHEIRLERGP